ncbi:MAG TPA: DUF4037 domain-containing protein [Chthonomonadaceae bacterium]|nr:DUF4037 domain-containing protein [Chthonomonadaceae bacterium]
MTESITDISREFFREIVLPIVERELPDVAAHTAFGLFGYGSEAYGLDDAYSRDHHFGLRIDALMPAELFAARRDGLLRVVGARLPSSYRGHALRSGHIAGAGLAPDSLPAFLARTIGLERPPQTYAEWLGIPEEDILHVTNGEVWHDPDGRFTAVRAAFAAYYPEPVRLRRIAHLCRYFSGMGTYALKRALLRGDAFYATTRFATAIRLGVQLAFLLDRRYAPYDKWLIAHFAWLPRLYAPLRPLVEEAVALGSPWERKLALLDRMADVLDETMVADGVIRPHPRFVGTETSGYRLLEHAYAELIQAVPDEIKTVVPQWDQVFLEQFHCRYVDGLDLAEWDSILGLRPYPA